MVGGCCTEELKLLRIVFYSIGVRSARMALSASFWTPNLEKSDTFVNYSSAVRYVLLHGGMPASW